MNETCGCELLLSEMSGFIFKGKQKMLVNYKVLLM